MSAPDTRRSLPVPTALGWKALAFMVAMSAASLAAPYNNLFFLLLCYLGALLTLTAAWSTRQLRGVHGTIESPPPFAAGSPIELPARVAVVGRPRFALRLVLELMDGTRLGGDVAYESGDVRGEVHVVGLPRGVHLVRSAHIESAFPAGLFRTRRQVEAPERLVVYPEPARRTPGAQGTAAIEGLAGDVVTDTGATEAVGLRPYRDGDDPRQVHWRASARRDALVVREWEGRTGSGAEVLLDRRAAADTFEHALRVLAALVLTCQEQERPVRFHTQGLSCSYGGDGPSYDALLTELAAIDALPLDGPAPPACSPGVLRLPAALEGSS